ncbi:MAG: hypothetical protein IPJ68_00095 [Candidatus Moraniibacteriota bacterium]|nr:MAG: hypothetical protein IPJ68_00095 [Candidatus Moranbacteria bacterium]
MHKTLLPTLKVVFFLGLFLLSSHSVSAAGRVFSDGFEDGTTTQWTDGTTAGAEGKCNIVTSALDGGTGPKSGTKMARCNWDGTQGALYGHSHQEMDTSWSMGNEALIRFHVRVDSDVDVKAGSKLFRWNGFNSFGAIQFEYGNGATLYTRSHSEDGTQLGPTNYGGGNAFRNGQWHQIELYIKKGSGGIIRVWVDDALVSEGLNINTNDSTWNQFHMMSNWSLNDGWEHDANNHMYWDEFEVYSDTGTSGTGSLSAGTAAQGSSDTTAPAAPTGLGVQ